jgi:uncharacterized protein YdaU (DUF1376 family)
MHFYQFHIGDYLSHTHHLTPMEDLAYRKMLDHAYLHERGLEGDAATVARLIGLRGYEKEVEAILSDFWRLDGGVWRNARVEKELAKMAEKREKAGIAGRMSAQKRNVRSTEVQRTLDGCSTSDERTNNGRPTSQDSNSLDTKSQEPVPTKRASRSVVPECPEDVPAALWNEWVAFRKSKRAPVTQLVIDSTRKTATEAGMTMTEAFTYWIANGQTGFFPPKNAKAAGAGGGRPGGYDRFGKWQGVGDSKPEDFSKPFDWGNGNIQ